ncbi:MAG: ribosome maturation factor RimP [Alphaproteobacteria bacterium]|nr:ribosome maturation factor RimP [Alphaproteobacteria bacterium]
MAHFLFWQAVFGEASYSFLQPRRSAELGGIGALLVDTNLIAHAIEPSLEGMGYRLVRVVITSGRRPTLQVMAERLDDEAMTVEDCAQISHSVSAILDVADPIVGTYMLEISSPGIDRPLVRAEDYDRFSGFEARIELRRPIEGRKRFRGRLIGTLAEKVRLATETGEVRLPLSDVARAKLVLTDDLIDASRRGPSQPPLPQPADRSQTH